MVVLDLLQTLTEDGRFVKDTKTILLSLSRIRWLHRSHEEEQHPGWAS